MSLRSQAKKTLPMVAKTARLGISIAQRKPLPYSITFILTHRCNFQCDYCDIPQAAGDEMNTKDFFTAIDELSGAGMARASFSGGEALIRSDALDIIGYAHERGLMTSLNTNGWFTLRHIQFLARHLNMLVLSLDGPQESHDLVRKKRGSYERVIEAIEQARSLGLPVATITVLSHANLHIIDDVLKLADQYQFWAYFQPAYSDCFQHSNGLDPALNTIVLERLSAELKEARANGRRVGASPSFLSRLERGPHFGDCGSCNAGRYFATVMPDGSVVPCHLVSKEQVYPNGRSIGFAKAFEMLPHPHSGPGCAISPYQESDLIFSLDPQAIAAAIQRLLPSSVPERKPNTRR